MDAIRSNVLKRSEQSVHAVRSGSGVVCVPPSRQRIPSSQFSPLASTLFNSSPLLDTSALKPGCHYVLDRSIGSDGIHINSVSCSCSTAQPAPPSHSSPPFLINLMTPISSPKMENSINASKVFGGSFFCLPSSSPVTVIESDQQLHDTHVQNMLVPPILTSD